MQVLGDGHLQLGLKRFERLLQPVKVIVRTIKPLGERQTWGSWSCKLE